MQFVESNRSWPFVYPVPLLPTRWRLLAIAIGFAAIGSCFGATAGHPVAGLAGACPAIVLGILLCLAERMSNRRAYLILQLTISMHFFVVLVFAFGGPDTPAWHAFYGSWIATSCFVLSGQILRFTSGVLPRWSLVGVLAIWIAMLVTAIIYGSLDRTGIMALGMAPIFAIMISAISIRAGWAIRKLTIDRLPCAFDFDDPFEFLKARRYSTYWRVILANGLNEGASAIGYQPLESPTSELESDVLKSNRRSRQDYKLWVQSTTERYELHPPPVPNTVEFVQWLASVAGLKRRQRRMLAVRHSDDSEPARGQFQVRIAGQFVPVWTSFRQTPGGPAILLEIGPHELAAEQLQSACHRVLDRWTPSGIQHIAGVDVDLWSAALAMLSGQSARQAWQAFWGTGRITNPMFYPTSFKDALAQLTGKPWNAFQALPGRQLLRDLTFPPGMVGAFVLSTTVPRAGWIAIVDGKWVHDPNYVRAISFEEYAKLPLAVLVVLVPVEATHAMVKSQPGKPDLRCFAVLKNQRSPAGEPAGLRPLTSSGPTSDRT